MLEAGTGVAAGMEAGAGAGVGAAAGAGAVCARRETPLVRRAQLPARRIRDRERRESL
jgi:hypothetical protein